MRKWWLSCQEFTVLVEADRSDCILWAAPLVRRFVGQSLENLLAWADKFGGVWVVELTTRAKKEAK